jgi:hypothetical protein
MFQSQREVLGSYCGTHAKGLAHTWVSRASKAAGKRERENKDDVSMG